MSNYLQGSVAKITGTFTNSSGVATDPTTVTFRVKSPAVTSASVMVYPSASQVVKDSTGVYHVNLEFDAEGTWLYRWEGTGTVEAAMQKLCMCMGAHPTT